MDGGGLCALLLGGREGKGERETELSTAFACTPASLSPPPRSRTPSLPSLPSSACLPPSLLVICLLFCFALVSRRPECADGRTDDATSQRRGGCAITPVKVGGRKYTYKYRFIHQVWTEILLTLQYVTLFTISALY